MAGTSSPGPRGVAKQSDRKRKSPEDHYESTFGKRECSDCGEQSEGWTFASRTHPNRHFKTCETCRANKKKKKLLSSINNARPKECIQCRKTYEGSEFRNKRPKGQKGHGRPFQNCKACREKELEEKRVASTPTRVQDPDVFDLDTSLHGEEIIETMFELYEASQQPPSQQPPSPHPDAVGDSGEFDQGELDSFFAYLNEDSHQPPSPAPDAVGDFDNFSCILLDETY